jgi:ubiquinone/menaquinone biosynthesis C-methylase UbiE
MKKFFKSVIKKRIGKIVDIFDDSIAQGDRVLDVGAGGGWIGKEIKKRKKAQVTLLDVIDFNRTDLDLVVYDGKAMPFPDNFFDVSLLIFTLHHCQNPLAVLKEAKRVTKNKIIIIEDVPISFFNKILLYFWDVVTNLPSLVKLPGENMFFNFKPLSEWERIFKDLQLKMISKKKFQSNKLINHYSFLLQA